MHCVQGLEISEVSLKKRLPPTPRALNSLQLTLPFEEAEVRRTLARLVKVTQFLEPQSLPDEELLHLLCKLRPEEFENLVLDCIIAMGMKAEKVGHTRAKDGGVDILFWPSTMVPVPYLGAIQVKHTQSPAKRVGPKVIREFTGVMNTQPFQVGMIVTNTSFTPDAQWFADQQRALVRLRDMQHLKYWIAEKFTDEAEWRERPRKIELYPGRTVSLQYPFHGSKEVDLVHSPKTQQ